MIGGFIIGNQTTDVLVRAIRPTLANFGVSGALADPTLELHDGNGALLASNDNWRSDQEAEIEATTLAPNDDLESAISAQPRAWRIHCDPARGQRFDRGGLGRSLQSGLNEGARAARAICGATPRRPYVGCRTLKLAMAGRRRQHARARALPGICARRCSSG